MISRGRASGRGKYFTIEIVFGRPAVTVMLPMHAAIACKAAEQKSGTEHADVAVQQASPEQGSMTAVMHHNGQLVHIRSHERNDGK